jgi:hypothetical protein
LTCLATSLGHGALRVLDRATDRKDRIGGDLPGLRQALIGDMDVQGAVSTLRKQALGDGDD